MARYECDQRHVFGFRNLVDSHLIELLRRVAAPAQGLPTKDNTNTETPQIYIHFPNRIRTAEDTTRLTPHGHSDQHMGISALCTSTRADTDSNHRHFDTDSSPSPL